MRLGVAIEDTWDFFNEIYADFQSQYTTSVFARRQLRSGPLHTRINKALLHNDLQRFMANNDVVFFEWSSELLAVASRLPKRCAVVTRLHRFELYEWADRINWDFVDRIILVAESKRSEFVERFPTQAAKTRVVNVAIDLEKFTYRPKQFRGNIGILCHLTPRKRVYELILAFSELVKQEPALHLHIVGGAGAAFRDYAEALHFVVGRLQIEDSVTFYGNMKNPWSWYPNIDIFVSNSYSEGLQVAPMEAMATGCYVLSHHWRGAEELVPVENLYLTDNQLLTKILEYCALPEQEKQVLSQAMRQRACEKFNIRDKLPQVRSVITDALEQRSGAVS
jgi:glycosyltransferase involved in cell wall biosynthesis